MIDREAQLLAILRVGHDTSMRGPGISLRDALTHTHYRNLRPGFGPGDLLPLIRLHTELVEEWILYSADKRTDGGWYLLEQGEIGQVGVPQSRMNFDSMEQAVAEYVVRELDFWAQLSKSG